MWLMLIAAAEVPLPDYEDAVVQRAWFEVNSLIEAACDRGVGMPCSPEPLDEAIQKATAFQDTVVRDARLEYLIGLAHLSKGDEAGGVRHLEASVKLDPERADAWHDLGEIYVRRGEFSEAEGAFSKVTHLVDTGGKAWLGPWRQAEVAAHQGNARDFEDHMRVALERGFSFRTIKGLPNWKTFYAHPDVGPAVRKLVTVYGTPDVAESLQK